MTIRETENGKIASNKGITQYYYSLVQAYIVGFVSRGSDYLRNDIPRIVRETCEYLHNNETNYN